MTPIYCRVSASSVCEERSEFGEALAVEVAVERVAAADVEEGVRVGADEGEERHLSKVDV